MAFDFVVASPVPLLSAIVVLIPDSTVVIVIAVDESMRMIGKGV